MHGVAPLGDGHREPCQATLMALNEAHFSGANQLTRLTPLLSLPITEGAYTALGVSSFLFPFILSTCGSFLFRSLVLYFGPPS